MKKALRPWWDPDTILVVGDCATGVDAIAHRIWKAAGGQVEWHQAHWNRYGLSAGPRRNAKMVNQGADHCIAFLLTSQPCKGTRNCIDLARAAGIPLTIVEQY